MSVCHDIARGGNFSAMIILGPRAEASTGFLRFHPEHCFIQRHFKGVPRPSVLQVFYGCRFGAATPIVPQSTPTTVRFLSQNFPQNYCATCTALDSPKPAVIAIAAVPLFTTPACSRNGSLQMYPAYHDVAHTAPPSISAHSVS